MRLSGQLISIEANNRAYVELDIKLNNDAGFKPIKFKFDTGADSTVISLFDLAQLGYDEALVGKLMKSSGSGSSATGENVEHFVIELSINHILGQIIPKGLKFPFLCMCKKHVPTPRPECEGCGLTGEIFGGFRRSLLGNDILSCFDIRTNRSQKNIEFLRLSDLTERNKYYHFCEVHDAEQLQCVK